MGMRTTLYGYIEELDLGRHPLHQEARDHNTQVIASLQERDGWPPLSREMFAISENSVTGPGCDLEYSGRIIHFGANLKSVEHEWKEWKAKFEVLLAKLYFLEAKVHFQTEYSLLETAR